MLKEKAVACVQTPLSPQAKKAEEGREVSLPSLSPRFAYLFPPSLNQARNSFPISHDLPLVPIHFREYKKKSVVNNYVKAAATEAYKQNGVATYSQPKVFTTLIGAR